MSKDPVAWFSKYELNIKDDYERGFIDGMQKQMQSSVDKAVNAMSKRTWVGLTYEEETELIRLAHNHAGIRFYIQATEAKLKEKNT